MSDRPTERPPSPESAPLPSDAPPPPPAMDTAPPPELPTATEPADPPVPTSSMDAPAPPAASDAMPSEPADLTAPSTEPAEPMPLLEPSAAGTPRDSAEAPSPIEAQEVLNDPVAPEASEPRVAFEPAEAPEPPEIPEPGEAPEPAKPLDFADVHEPEADSAAVSQPADKEVEPLTEVSDQPIVRDGALSAEEAPDPVGPEGFGEPEKTEAPDELEKTEEFDNSAEGGFLSWAHDIVLSKGNSPERSMPKEATIDRPDLPKVDLTEFGISFHYGTPLDRPDGTRLPLFDGPPTREQTEQGMLGDCGIIATMGAVAGHRPELISQCMRENADGTYEVILHQTTHSNYVDWRRYEPTGAVVHLTVTPDLPVVSKSPNSPAYAHSGESEAAWPSILEKGIAGVDQAWDENRTSSTSGYERLGRGSNPNTRAELLAQLTGEPAYTEDFPTSYDHQGRSPARQILQTFREKLAENRPILVGTRALEEGEPGLSHKLTAKHAYEVTGVDDRGLIHLRNPYNEGHPKPLTFKEFKDSFKNRYTTTE